MQKARGGEPITIGFIGGSITHGQAAMLPDRCYANLVTQWWAEHFPKSHVSIVNAGVNGTGSGYGVFRLQRDLLSQHPDVVIVEFGVNDKSDLAHAETYEGLIRQLLSDADQPAVLQLFLMHHDGTSAQDFQAPIGRRYGLLMVSYRDALWPEVAAGRLKWSDFTDGPIHPNDQGHALAAMFITSMLQQVLDHLPEKSAPVAMRLPLPVYTDLYGRTKLIPAGQLKPLRNDGWIYDPGHDWWFSQTPGSVIEFEATGRAVDLLYAKVSRDAGQVQVTADDLTTTRWDGWFDATWAGYVQADEVCRDSESELHRVRVELLNSRYDQSHGHEFRIVGLGVAE